MPKDERRRAIRELSREAALFLKYAWEDIWARPEQLEPEGIWQTLLFLTGRGWGKTRTGSELVRNKVESREKFRVALVAETPADARDVMIQGESGILVVSPPWFYPKYEPSKRRLTWPNGAIATVYSGANPEQLRGPQFDFAWCDELASWQYPRETYDNLMFCMRLGDTPQTIITTTPKAITLLKEIMGDENTRVVTGSTYDNKENLPEPYFKQIISQYEGTRVGRQEIYAELLDDAPGALWKRVSMIDEHRVREEDVPELVRVVVAVDPAVTANKSSNETGIVVVGVGIDDDSYVLADRSCRKSPDGWGRRVVNTYHEFNADRVVAEVNNGGDLVKSLINSVDPKVAYKEVRASRGKQIRAEPVAALYERGRVHHVGEFKELEDQLCTWEPGDDSPDRLDAVVWAITELMLGEKKQIVNMTNALSGLTRESTWRRWRGG